MSRRVTLRRQPEGCPVCGSPKAKLGVSHKWNQHKIGPAFDDGIRYGSEGSKPYCPASGRDRYGIDDLLRTFEAWDNPTGTDRKRLYRQTATLVDNGDSVILSNALQTGDADPLVISVHIHPDDTLRLIDELTAIAKKRGLI